MNAFLMVLILFGGLIAWEKSLLDQRAISLDSLCIIDGKDCKRSPTVKTSLDKMDGNYCLSNEDLEKIVNKLQRCENH